MKIWTVAVPLALLAACSSSDAPGIAGKLVVHTGLPASALQGQTMRVLLGDGTKFNQAVDANGDVTFQDGALQGAQTVTMVESNGSANFVQTLVGIDSPEIWLPEAHDHSRVVLGTISGKVSGIVDGGDPLTVILDGDAHGAEVIGDGAFTLQVYGPDGGVDAGTCALFAIEQGLGPRYFPVRMGMRTDVPIGGQIVGQDIALDHPFDQTFTATVPNASTYGDQVNLTASYRLKWFNIESSGVIGPSPLTIATMALTPPYDRLALVAGLDVGNEESLPNGDVELRRVVTSSSATLTLPEPLSITSPALGTEPSHPTVSAQGLALAWVADPAAQLVSFELDNSTIDWRVIAPAGLAHFTYFPLPSNASTAAGFSGEAELHASELHHDGYPTIDSLFTRDYDTRAYDAADYWETYVHGYLKLD